MANENISINDQSDERIDWASLTPEEAAETLLEKVLNAPATLTKENVDEDEASLNAQSWIRRTGVSLQTISGRELCENVKDDKDTAIVLAEWSNAVGEYIKKVNAIVEILEASRLRVMVALARREDVDQIMEAAAKDDQGDAAEIC